MSEPGSGLVAAFAGLALLFALLFVGGFVARVGIWLVLLGWSHGPGF